MEFTFGTNVEDEKSHFSPHLVDERKFSTEKTTGEKEKKKTRQHFREEKRKGKKFSVLTEGDENWQCVLCIFPYFSSFFSVMSLSCGAE